MIASVLRRTLQAGLLITLVTALAACGTAAPQGTQGTAPAAQEAKGAEPSAKAKEVRIGFQKYGTMNFLKAEGKLDARLKEAGYTVNWTEFPGGPQLLEALNVGSLDLGHTGEAPPIFAQAAGAPLVYLAHEPASPKSEAILVPENSPLKSVAELKGKKVALNKGSNVHYLLVKQLEKAGLKYGDIQTVFLPPADARVAFERGSVDAWVIWDPFFAAAQTATKARVLADGTDVVSNHEFYLAARSFAENNREVTAILLEELNKVDEWAKTNQGELAKLLSPQLGIDIPSLETASKRREYGVLPIDDKVIAEQQKIADTFLQVGLIPKPIQVKEAVLSK
ncbi:sulfonate ABC transporter periplasmic sulfonate-binding protein SsuA [Paenibacillus mucilaginosus 3016]|uniref:Putative aliphatic sulfonates-binding protein n=1 Tax=Paenibacillus mucilaginosus 3016 TaxID=1116391 RepID=H6NHS3_9BACL|nr:sulfonate ABC transporter substrate-binding protein [Paenibacillus mucilaginosus]AFC30144.1 sulfonate ABC transporter periplasmic sulfonate-binding protein SsuA [Paenibacillus mucilaginosus 3016]WFA18797.1 sulfonate ABC transporter substrate-binding protein [Paenibacillus mucilaginosus]